MTTDMFAQEGAQSSRPGDVMEHGGVVAGLDLGSTGVKVLILDSSGAELVSEHVPTPWCAGPGGSTEMEASVLVSTVRELLDVSAEKLRILGAGPVQALGIAGMGETGLVVDEDGLAVAPAFAWFDPRGVEQMEAFPEELRHEFPGRTGLPMGVQVSATKLALLRDMGVTLRGRRWLNLPEFVAASLGGDVALEYSLTSRTGLLDQDQGNAWLEMMTELGVDESFLPALRDAGLSWGRASDVGTHFDGALLTVAGHDHLVAAEANGALAADSYHVSIGTAEVLLRVIDGPLPADARKRLADHLINEVRHVVPGKHVLVAGVKTGLLLRRVLQMSGITSSTGREELDQAVMKLTYEGALPDGAIQVSGARNDDGVLALTLRADGVSPAEVFGAVLRHSVQEIRTLIAAMDREVPPAVHTTLTGGWAQMGSVKRARERVLPRVTVSPHQQSTALGAAIAAARLLK